MIMSEKSELALELKQIAQLKNVTDLSAMSHMDQANTKDRSKLFRYRDCPREDWLPCWRRVYE